VFIDNFSNLAFKSSNGAAVEAVCVTDSGSWTNWSLGFVAESPRAVLVQVRDPIYIKVR
jgi:hypothetical protein